MKKSNPPKPTLIVDLVNDANKLDGQENLVEEITASSLGSLVDRSKATEIGLVDCSKSSSEDEQTIFPAEIGSVDCSKSSSKNEQTILPAEIGSVDCSKSSSEDEQTILPVARSKVIFTDQQEYAQKETSDDVTFNETNISSGHSGNLSHCYVDGCCPSSTPKITFLSEVNQNVPQNDFHYKFSEECDLLVKIIPDKFQKGYKVVHHPESNQTWISGQVYRRKEATKPWVFVQWLELHDATRKAGGGAVIDQYNFALASYTRVVDFLQCGNNESNLIFNASISDLFNLIKFNY